MEHDSVTITNCKVTGVINPFLNVEGILFDEKSVFDVVIDGNHVSFNYAVNGNRFAITKVLSAKDNVIKIYLLTKGDKKNLVCTIKNRFLSRAKNKVNEVFSTYTHTRSTKNYINTLPYYNPFSKEEYLRWLKENDKEVEHNDLKYRPLISVLIPVYNVSPKWLSLCIDSILNQTYDNFEICLVDDASTNERTIKCLKKYEKSDSRIKVKYNKENGNISKATNDALAMAKGEFVALVDDDDELDVDAFYYVVDALNKNKKLDFIYTDEDKIDIDGKRCEPHFKPDYSPDTLLSLNYISHLCVIRKSLMESVGGEEVGLEGTQDYDLYLKLVEKTENIYHIPKILYHWRKIIGSTSMSLDSKDAITERTLMSINNALKRRNISGVAEQDKKSMYYKIAYKFDKEPLVSIIIPTKDYADITDQCLKSIYDKTTYHNFEIILVNNRSEKEETFEMIKKYKGRYKNFRVVDADMEFNYSKINNLAIKKSKGKYICLLNNDTKILTPEWLNIMVGYAMQKHVGAVGAKLLYPDMTVQHGGVLLGLGGVASHAYIGASREDCGAYGRLAVPYDYGAVTAACLVVSKDKYEEVGGLEEDLKVAYNDVDFNLKLLKKGYYNVETPQVELMHYESKSRGLDTSDKEKYARFRSEEKYMYKKWRKLLNYDPFYNSNYSKRWWFVLEKNKS
ncbi:glycosyltransferase [bacterium]|nr:glycosyltransferase [bacterium]